MTFIQLGALLLSCLAVTCYGRGGHDGTEHSTMDFYYDPVGKYLVAQSFSTCFLAKLTQIEQDHAHTNTGMDDLELMMLRDILGKVNETRVYHDNALPTNIQKWCSDRDLFILERPLEVMTTSGSLLVG